MRIVKRAVCEMLPGASVFLGAHAAATAYSTVPLDKSFISHMQVYHVP
jgi:hypothetical protein